MNKKTNSPVGVLLILDKLDLGGGARRIKVYSDLLNRSVFTPVVVIRSTIIHRNIDAVIGKDTPRLHSCDPNEILDFAKSHRVKVAYCWYDGKFHQDLFALLSLLKRNALSIVANNVFSYVDKQMDDLCDVVVFQTKFMLYKFERQLTDRKHSSKKYVVLPNPVHGEHLRSFTLTAEERRFKRASLGFKPSDVIFGRFGRNDIVKWGDGLTEAMLRHLHHPTIKFLIVGMPRSRRFLFALLTFLDPSISSNLKILSPTSSDRELFELMQCTDVIAHSVKIGEGCSNAINEGMYWGKPIITNPTPHCDNGQVEQVIHTKSGLIVRNNSEWNEAIEKLATKESLRKKLGNTANTMVNTNIEGKSIVKLFEQVLRVAMGELTSNHLITLESREYQTFVSNYTKNSRLSSSVLPATVSGKCCSFLLRAGAYLEFKFFNG